MDEIPLPLRPALASPYPTDEQVIRRIRQAVAAKPAWTPAGEPEGAEVH
jgi:formylmethanofuran dehydrogenase subunit B